MNSAVPTNLTNNESVDDGEEMRFAEYFDILIDYRWLIAAFTATSLFLGLCYSLFAIPVYESNFSVQVEDSDKSAGSFLGDAASSLLSVKTPSAGEIEVVRSRLILSQVVENTKLYISAEPMYLPIVGRYLARNAINHSEPGFLGANGFVSGNEKITVPRFDVSPKFEGKRFTITRGEADRYTLSFPDASEPVQGRVGTVLTVNRASGNLSLLVSEIDGMVGAKFNVASNSKQRTLSNLQDGLRVIEKGKQSGVLDISWQSPDPEKLTQVLSEIGRLYIRQNIDRKAAEAEKTLLFLDTELPKFKNQLEQSEDVYNRFRNQNGTVSLDDEARNALSQTIDLQAKLLDAQQRRRDLNVKFTAVHPAVRILDSQIADLNGEIAKLDAQIRRMPMLQQTTVRMQRDIKVNTDLYVSLLNSSLQMRLAKEGKVGNVRLLDEPTPPEAPVSPKKSMAILLSIVVGLMSGILFAITRASFFGGIRSPNEIEAHTRLSVYSSVPLSGAQTMLERNMHGKAAGLQVLALTHPEDPSIESLRSLRTAMQFSMLQSTNNRLLISGPTPGVGKTFISVNFSALVAASGKRVLLIDADLRKGRVNQFLSLRRSPGLSELIAGTHSADDVVHREVLTNLDVIVTGSLPPNPAELLMSKSFSDHLESLSERYDLVIIDTAPVLVATDTAAVASNVGNLLLVARAGKTQVGEINESVKRLNQAGGHATGVILNAMDLSRRHTGSYGYRYGAYRYTQYKYKDE